ncbi:PQQ-dependent sugar dehydrogenase [Candidatus Parcubacteria bacterium]|nr:PQQ-dependent sugar dehydrogenase [Candidatus Parcubacteria bacterium]
MTSDKIQNWWVFPGFEIELMATGFTLPVNISFVPKPSDDPKAPLAYVTELYSGIKVITNNWKVKTYSDTLLNYDPNYLFPGTGESGIIGICVEPNTGDLFVTMIYDDDGETKAKLVRTKSKDGLKIESSEVIIDNIPSVKAAHQIQTVTIGPDKKLYVNIGDGMIDPNVAQDDNDLRGKILRINFDGSIPIDNPNPKSSIFAKGFRNPFGAIWRKSDKSLYISDNGPANDDRLAKVEAGKNYGWPESMRKNSFFVWNYTHAPTALDFMQNKQFKEKYNDELFVALFGSAYAPGRAIKGKKIVKLKLTDNSEAIKSYDDFVVYIGEKAASPCGLSFGIDGLYFTDLHGEGDKPGQSGKGNIYRIKQK